MARERAHREFLVPGDAEFAHYEDIQRCIKTNGNFIGDGNAPARESENQNIPMIRVLKKFFRQNAAGFHPIFIGERHTRT